MSDVEETIKRIQSQKGVVGVIVMDNAGRAIRSTLDDEQTAQYSALLQTLCERAKGAIRELDSTNDLTFLRLRTKKVSESFYLRPSSLIRLRMKSSSPLTRNICWR
ncbi:dyrb-1 [Pristionchus pacificus]|uniref:Roadblock/LAMTOR2 domain-containing protein n=1 Tax=Pristionchus pacificus TaxID=54126 RepID=A0A8R1ZBR7_PRIPA|nr:dyrb-1 [Pristionchus pacificus]